MEPACPSMPATPPIWACVLAALSASLLPVSAQTATKPNVILILIDDLGWHEMGSYGNTFNETPQLDKLAREGVRFGNAYSSAPVCSPARSTIMTGQLPIHTGITDYMDDNFVEFLDPAKFVSIAKTLKNRGYHTGIIGKWHLDGHAANGLVNTGAGRPALNGFDEVICSETKRIGGGDYVFPYAHLPDVAQQRIFPKENLIERLNLEATDYIARNKSAPFFLYLSHYAVHTSLDAPDSLVARFDAKRATPGTKTSPTENPYLGAMLKLVDDGVGKILATLKEAGIDSNTIVMVASDNGGESTVTDNGALRGGKSYVYEGGIRIPFLARWPGKFASGIVSGTPINLADIYPTVAALTGANLPQGQKMDGLDISPLLERTGGIANRDFLWHYPRVLPHFLGGSSAGAILRGHYKFVRFYDTDKTELYDLGSDSAEAKDLAADSVALLRSMAAEWHRRVTESLAGFAFPDDFNDKDPADWRPFGGTWSAQTGRYATTSGSGFKSVTDHKYFTDFMYQARIILPGGAGNAGLVFRVGHCDTGTDAYRGYYAGINSGDGQVTFGRADNGVWTLLGKEAHAIDAGTEYLLRVAAKGAEFKIYVNDTLNPVLVVSDAKFDGGLIGVRSHTITATFDDVLAVGLAPDSAVVAARPAPDAAPGPARNYVVGSGSRLVRIPFPKVQRDPSVRFSLFDIAGKAVRAPLGVEAGRKAWVLRLAPGIPSGYYSLRLSYDGRGEVARLLVL